MLVLQTKITGPGLLFHKQWLLAANGKRVIDIITGETVFEGKGQIVELKELDSDTLLVSFASNGQTTIVVKNQYFVKEFNIGHHYRINKIVKVKNNYKIFPIDNEHSWNIDKDVFIYEFGMFKKLSLSEDECGTPVVKTVWKNSIGLPPEIIHLNQHKRIISARGQTLSQFNVFSYGLEKYCDLTFDSDEKPIKFSAMSGERTIILHINGLIRIMHDKQEIKCLDFPDRKHLNMEARNGRILTVKEDATMAAVAYKRKKTTSVVVFDLD